MNELVNGGGMNISGDKNKANNSSATKDQSLIGSDTACASSTKEEDVAMKMEDLLGADSEDRKGD